MDTIVLQLLLQAALIAINAVFACAEIALISINSVKLEKLASDGSRKAKRLLSLTSKPAKFLATIQVGITLAGFLGSAFAAENFSDRLAAALVKTGIPEATLNTVSLVLITLVLSFLTLVLGELVPKRIAMRKAERLAFALSSLVVFISKLFAPVVWLLTRSTNGLLRLFGIDPEAEEEAVTEEEIRLLIEAGSEKGSIASGEKEIINNVFEFNDITAEEVMTHRRDTAVLWLKDEDGEWERIVLENRHSYYPVCGENIDDIRGVLCARDYLGLGDRSRPAVMERAVKPAQLVPNTAPANVLFKRMKSRRNHFAVVVDEYGSVDGIVTMNDLLEALVGDLADSEEKAELPAIEKKGPGLWRISGAASLDKAAAETGAALPVESYDTFGGYVFTLLGRIPKDGEKPELEDSGLVISGIKIKDRRLVSALVRKVSARQGAGDTPKNSG
ncbi:MAG: hemolysin family protein [Treponema sp.]|jgi:putative hemolysin|nr:hemolysin family protein [Treponema sp.]